MRHPILVFIAIAYAAGSAWCIYMAGAQHNDWFGQDVAAWVQGTGTIAAVFIAIWAPFLQRELEAERLKLERIASAAFLFDGIEEALNAGRDVASLSVQIYKKRLMAADIDADVKLRDAAVERFSERFTWAVRKWEDPTLIWPSAEFMSFFGRAVDLLTYEHHAEDMAKFYVEINRYELVELIDDKAIWAARFTNMLKALEAMSQGRRLRRSFNWHRPFWMSPRSW